MLPQWFVSAPWARRTGHLGMTYLSWTFVALPRAEIGLPVHDGFRRHERRHVMQSWAVTLAWALLVAVLVAVAEFSGWWMLTALVAWPVVYGVASVVAKYRTGKGYTDNVWERDAFRYEERTRPRVTPTETR